LITAQVDEPGVPRVDSHPLAGLGAALPTGLSSAGLVDAEHLSGLRLGQWRLGVRDERAVRGRPRHAVGRGDLGHRPSGLADTCSRASMNEPRSQ
jgi:hypothetical protein